MSISQSQLPKKKIEGTLKLKGQDAGLLGKKTWKSCYAVLEPDLFLINIYAKEEDVFMHQIKEEINLQYVRDLKLLDKKGGRRLDLVTFEGKCYSFLTDSQGDAQKWYSHILPFKDVKAEAGAGTGGAQQPTAAADQWDGVQTRPAADSLAVAENAYGLARQSTSSWGSQQDWQYAHERQREEEQKRLKELAAKQAVEIGELPPLPPLPEAGTEAEAERKAAPGAPDSAIRPVRVAIVGTGWGARVQVPAFRQAGMEVTMMYSRSEHMARRICQELGISRGTSKFDQVVRSPQVDLVSIVTPPGTHLPMVKRALAGGKHVLCEKPAALTVEQAETMLKLAKKYPTQVAMIDHELRFLPSVNQMRCMVAAGKIGQVLHFEARLTSGSRLHNKRWDWWSQAEHGGGVLYAIGSHVIDLITYVTGHKIARVSGIVNTCIKERMEEASKTMKPVTSDDFVSSHAQLANGVHGRFLCSVVTAGESEHYFAVTGTQGTLTLRRNQLSFYAAGQTGGDRREEIVTEDPLLQLPGLDNVWGTATYFVGQSLQKHLSKFIDVSLGSELKGRKVLHTLVRGRGVEFKDEDDDEESAVSEPAPTDEELLEPFAADVEDGLYVQRVMDAIKESDEDAMWVDVDLDMDVRV